jgi:hypothetical protein
MINKILIIIVLFVCILYIIYTIRKGNIWVKSQSTYTNILSIRAFIMAIVIGICIILMILKEYSLL